MRKRIKKHLLRVKEIVINSLILMFCLLYMGYWYMSKKHKHRKHKPQNNHKKGQSCEKTEKVIRREPIAVMEMTKHTSNNVPNPKPNINNTCPGYFYKVVSKPAKWSGNCGFVGKTGQCQGTDNIHGAKLKFPDGEIIHIPFDNIEIVEPIKKSKEVAAEDFIEFEGPPNHKVVRGHTYKVTKKPSGWKVQCRFVGRVGKCILIDEKGEARLRFSDGDDVSFPIDCIEEMPSIDLNDKSDDPYKEKVTEDNVRPGDLYRIIKRPDRMGEDADRLIGKIGKAKWVNYRGVCLKFSDTAGYTIDFDSIEKYTPIQLSNPTIVPMKLNASNIVMGRKYKVAKLPGHWPSTFNQLLGRMGIVLWASDPTKGAMMDFTLSDGSKLSKVIPFDCMEDLPRPAEAELLEIIKKNPEKILRVIKGLNKMTRLKPVRDFVECGVLPDVSVNKTETHIPECLSETVDPPTVGEACEQLQNRLLALIGPIQSSDIQNPS